MNTSIIAFGTILVNAILCAAFATVPDTFITSTALLAVRHALRESEKEDRMEGESVTGR